MKHRKKDIVARSKNCLFLFFGGYDPTKARNYEVHIVKMHQFDDVLPYGKYDHILATRRDLRDVAASAIRKGMIKNSKRSVNEYLIRVANLE